MEWYIFYEEYSNMSDVNLRNNVISLSDIGDGNEVVDVITNINNAEIRLRLLEKAMELDAVFTEEDFLNLDGEIPSALYVKLARYGNLELGTGEDVTFALESIFDENARRALYERAYIDDVKFTVEQLERIGYEDIDSAHQPFMEERRSEKTGYGCMGCLIGFFSGWRKRG